MLATEILIDQFDPSVVSRRLGERTPGYLRVMFAVDDIDGALERLRTHDAQLAWSSKRRIPLCHLRGPEGLLIGLAQELS